MAIIKVACPLRIDKRQPSSQIGEHLCIGNAIWFMKCSSHFLEGHDPTSWDLSNMPPPNIIMGLYAWLQFMPAQFMLTFEEAFLTGFFEQ